MAKKTESTLRCVLTLAIIAVICGLLLSILNPVLAVEPTADDLEANFTEGYTWKVLDLKDCDTDGGKVTLVAEGTKTNEDTIIGLIVMTNSDGKLGESTYAMYVNKTTNKLDKVCFIKEGATGGFTFDKYVSKKAHAGSIGEVATGATALTGLLTDASASGEGGEPMDLEDFCGVEITDAEAFSEYKPPVKTGATKTANAVYNSFNIMAKYYAENFLEGGNA